MQSNCLSRIIRAVFSPGQASCGCKGLKGGSVSLKVMGPGVWWLPGTAGATPIIGGHRGYECMPSCFDCLIREVSKEWTVAKVVN